MPHQATRKIVAAELAAGAWRHDESAVARATARERIVGGATSVGARIAANVLEFRIRRGSLLGPMARYLGTGHAGDTFGFPTWVQGVPSGVLQCTLSIVAYSSVVRMGFEM
jgi:hypothetical protein